MYEGGGIVRVGGLIVSGLSAAAGVLLLAGLILVAVLLVRFLLVGTRAAQLYLDRHEPKTTSAPHSGTAAAAPTPAAGPPADALKAETPGDPETPPAAPKSAIDHAAGGVTGTTEPPAATATDADAGRTPRASAPRASAPRTSAPRTSAPRTPAPRAPRAPRTPPPGE